MEAASFSDGERPLALVTGGSQGIGAAVVWALARAGVDVVIAARGLERCEQLADQVNRESGGRAFGLALDVTDGAAIDGVAQAVLDLTGRSVDWLVNNAGAAGTAPVLRTSDEAFLAAMDLNFHGARRMASALMPGMLANGGGRVVSVASSAGLHGYAYCAAYCAAKHALVGWTRAAAIELAPKQIGVRAVCPHFVDTPMLADSIANVVAKTGKTEAEARAFFAAENPGGKLVTPGEVAGAVIASCLAEPGAGDPVFELTGA